jgi:hypothetical protein
MAYKDIKPAKLLETFKTKEQTRQEYSQIKPMSGLSRTYKTDREDFEKQKRALNARLRQNNRVINTPESVSKNSLTTVAHLGQNNQHNLVSDTIDRMANHGTVEEMNARARTQQTTEAAQPFKVDEAQNKINGLKEKRQFYDLKGYNDQVSKIDAEIASVEKYAKDHKYDLYSTDELKNKLTSAEQAAKDSNPNLTQGILDFIGTGDWNYKNRNAITQKEEIENAYRARIVSEGAQERLSTLQNEMDSIQSQLDNLRKQPQQKKEIDAQLEAKRKEYNELYHELYGDPNLGEWLYDSATAGVAGFNKTVSSTADFLIGTPLKTLGFENNPISSWNEQQTKDYAALKEKSSQSTKRMGSGKGWEAASSLAEGVTQAIPDAVLALMTAGVSEAPTLGYKATGLMSTISTALNDLVKNPMYWTSVSRELGTNYEEAKADGATDFEAVTSATLSSLLNGIVEVGGGIETLPKELAAASGSKKAARQWVKSMLDEGKEEIVQGVIGNLTSKMAYDTGRPVFSMEDENAVINPYRMAEEGLMGAAVGGILGGGQVAASSILNGLYSGAKASSPIVGLSEPTDEFRYAPLSTTSAGENMQFVNTSGRVDSASRSLYNNTSRKNAGIQPLRNAQATVVSTGERVKLSDAPIHAVEDGQVILNTSSGRVPLSSVRFENPQVPMIYAMAVDGYGAKTANLYINGYDRAVAYNPNMDIETYTYAFENIARKSAEVGSESRVRSELPGELSEIGEAAFLYAYGAGPAFKNAKERGKYGGEEARNGQNNGDRAGALRPSEGLEAGADVGARSETVYSKSSGIQRTAQQNDIRGKNGRGQKVTRRIGNAEYTYSETGEEAKTERSRALQAELAELGVDSTVIDSRAEAVRNGNSSILGGEATTIADGSVLVRNDGESTAPTKRISGHEFFHVAEKKGVALKYRESITEGNLMFSSQQLSTISDNINTVYGSEFSIVENPVRFYNEFCAFVSGDIYENGGSLSAEFASMFHNPAAVEAAWADMRARFVPSERAIYTSAIHKAEEAGKQGFSWDYTAQKYAPYIEEIGQQAFQDAYNAGRANLSHGKRAAAKTGTAVREKAAGLTASKEKRFAQKIVRKIGKATGVHFQVVDSLPQKDGKATYGKMEYDEKGNPIITISMESPNLISTAFHELTHWMKDAAPNEWERYAGYVMNWIEDRDGRTAEALIDSYMERYGFAQDEEGRAAAMEEIVCDASEAMLDDKTAVLDFANRNKGIAKKIADFFSDLFETIRSYLAEHGKATAIGRALSEQETLVRDMRDLWVQAYDAAVKNAGKSKPAAENGGERYSRAENNDAITSSDIETLRSIGRKSVNEFTSLDIQKSARWARKFYKELGIKSPFFRAWFGDWRAADTTPITYTEVDTLDIADVVMQNGDYTISDTKWTVHAGKTLREETVHYARGKQVSVKALSAVRDILSNAILLDTEISSVSSSKKSPNTAFMHKLYAPIQYDGREYIAKVTVEEYYDEGSDTVKRKAYHLQSIKIETADGRFGVSSYSPRSDTVSIHSVSDLFSLVKQYDKGFKPRTVNPALLSEDGTPKVFYHGTDAEFTVFDRTKGRSNMDIQGMFFSPWELDAQGYGSNVGAYYLNFKNPASGRKAYRALNMFKGQNNAGVKARELLEKEGYDGVIFDDEEYVAFYPTQIKSATDNIGTFDENNPDIRHSMVDIGDVDLSALLEENNRLRRANAHLKEQFKLTQGKKPNRNAVEKLCKKILREYSSDYDLDTMVSNFDRLFSYLASGGDSVTRGGVQINDVDFDVVMELSTDIAKQVLEKSSSLNTGLWDYYADLRQDLRNTEISISEKVKEEIDYTFGNRRSFLNRLFGRVRITNDGIPLDAYWTQLSDQYPDLFDADTNEYEQPIRLIEVLDSIKPYYENAYEMNMDETAAALAGEIFEAYFDIPEMQTFADKKAVQLNALKTKYKGELAEYKASVKEKNDRKFAELKKNYQQKTQKVLDRKNEQLLRQKAKYRESRELERIRRREGDRIRTLKTRIKKTASTLSNMLLSPTDQKHIPDSLNGAVLEMLKLLDFDTGVRKPDGSLTQAAQRITNLKSAYEQLSKETSEFGNTFYDPDISEALDELSRAAKGKTVSDLMLSELETVSNVVDYFHHVVTQGNRMFAENRKETVSQLGQQAIDDIRSLHKISDLGISVEQRKMLGVFDRLLNQGIIKPYYFFKNIGGTLNFLYTNIRNGENKWALLQAKARDYLSAAKEKNGYKDWSDTWKSDRRSFTLSNQDTIDLTVDEIMYLYLLNKRKQARLHLLQGGITIDPKVLGKFKNRSLAKEGASLLTPADIQEITSSLTEDQRRFADDLGKYLSVDCAEQGNEVSLKMYGYKKFTDPNYVPIHTDDNFRYSKTAPVTDQRIKSSGFTKSTVPNANNPILLLGLSEVWSNHVEEMSTYNAFCLPIEDFNRVYNYQVRPDFRGGVSGTSVKSVLGKTRGQKANAYITQMLQDLNGGVRTSLAENFSGTLLSKTKKVAVSASLSVAIQQPTAIARALSVVDPKYFGKTLLSGKGTNTWEECKKYCGCAFIKEMGYFDTNLGQSTADWLLSDDYRTMGEKLAGFFKDSSYRDEMFLKLPSLMDQVTWCHIWNAVKAETKDLHPDLKYGDEAFFKASADRFQKVIDETQVYDSVFQRCQVMRDKSITAKAATAFMSEPITTYNMLYDAFFSSEQLPGKARAQKIARVAGCVLLSWILNSLAKSLIYAGREDNDREYWKRYLENFAKNLISEPLSMVPYLNDIYSMFMGYEAKDMTMQLFSDSVKSATALMNPNKSVGEKIYSIADSISAWFEIPLKNIRRDAKMIWNMIEEALGAVGVIDFQYDVEVEDIFSALQSGNTQNAKSLIKNKLAYLELQGKSVSAAKSTVRALFTKEYKEQYIQATLNNDNAMRNNILKWMYNSGLFESREDVQKRLRTWLVTYFREAYLEADSVERRKISQQIIRSGVYTSSEIVEVVQRWLQQE